MSCFKKISDIVDGEHFDFIGNPKIESLPPRMPPDSKSPCESTSDKLWTEAVLKSEIRGLYQNASLENCPLIPSAIVELGKRWVKAEKKPSLYLYGNTGSGKTYFSTAIYRHLVESGCPWVIFVRSHDLDDELLTAIEEKQEKTRMMKYFEVPVLFIDDLGVERPSDRVIRQYYSIIDRRVGDGLKTIITSNVPREDLPLGDRIISRLELFYAVEFPKKDIRKTLNLPLL